MDCCPGWSWAVGDGVPTQLRRAVSYARAQQYVFETNNSVAGKLRPYGAIGKSARQFRVLQCALLWVRFPVATFKRSTKNTVTELWVIEFFS